MFRGILPSKRIVSGDFTMVTPLGDVNGKENHPDPASIPLPTTTTKPTKPASNRIKSFGLGTEKKGKLSKAKEQPAESEDVDVEQAFAQLMNDLQIPKTLRPKLETMEASVKAAMLKSSQTMVLTPPLPSPAIPTQLPMTPRAATLRRARSSDTLSSPRAVIADLDFPEPPQSAGLFSGLFTAQNESTSRLATPRKVSNHQRGTSLDVAHTLSRANVSALDLEANGGKGSKDKGYVGMKTISPTKFFSILAGTSSTELDVENVKKLTMMLRNESASWTEDFLKLGGYSALLTRLNEILEVEWREEQHDDQVLHELLRCFKALSTSSIGCFALRSSCPTPFDKLIALLYSDKKPGEVATRQLIIDLILILFELYPPSSLPSAGSALNGRSRLRREVWEDEDSIKPSALVTLPAPHKTFFSLIQALLLTPAPLPAESPASPISPHAFIESLHRPRIYKTYLQELSDLCRDYFWVFCHPGNTVWVLADVDEGKVERPRAPGGMTGGVEFEAMGYFTTHLRLLNGIAKCVEDLKMPKEHEHSAFKFHTDLFLSGLERIILISRKASTAYYPTLHLELSRYVAFAGRAGYELPWTVSRLIGLPPSNLCKNRSSANTPSRAAQRVDGSVRPSAPEPGVPRGARPPAIPSPRKVEPLKFDA